MLYIGEAGRPGGLEAVRFACFELQKIYMLPGIPAS